MPYYSPLRYPGGKRRLIPFLRAVVAQNGLDGLEYVEPYAGSAAAALGLLMEGVASRIRLNDLARPIFAFWHSVLNDHEALCARILRVRVSMAEWKAQKAVLDRAHDADLGDLGFATLFMNRTNRSGILSGGVIGGMDQSGPWRLDARFNKHELVRRIRVIHERRSSILLSQLDAAAFVRKVAPALRQRHLVFYDPPYIENGAGLYLNNYTIDGHRDLEQVILAFPHRWIVTYDRGALDHGLYLEQRSMRYWLHYVSQSRYRGQEVMFLADGLRVPIASQVLNARMHGLTRPERRKRRPKTACPASAHS